MKNTIYLTNDEYSRCKIGEEICIIRLLQSQPPDGYGLTDIDDYGNTCLEGKMQTEAMFRLLKKRIE